ncbi:MAG TPA: HAD family phosphatase [Solirubrobacteraceae bacterium]|nr:HAD family phosphatase [Solirubrobacteraceae bacterium]
MTIEAVVLDIGGVLERTPETGWRDRWAARLGLPRATFDARLAPVARAGSLGEIDLAEVERRLAAAYGLDDEALAELMDDLWCEYLGSLDEPVAEYFASLRPRYRTGILSNSFAGAREREQAAYGFAQMCDAVVYSHEEGVLKPDPRSYAIVCERLGVVPARAVFVDDVAANVDGARAVGMRGILFTDAEGAIEELRGLLQAA